MKSLRPLLQDLREDKEFRLKVAFAVVMPFYVAGIVGVFMWAMIANVPSP